MKWIQLITSLCPFAFNFSLSAFLRYLEDFYLLGVDGLKYHQEQKNQLTDGTEKP